MRCCRCENVCICCIQVTILTNFFTKQEKRKTFIFKSVKKNSKIEKHIHYFLNRNIIKTSMLFLGCLIIMCCVIKFFLKWTTTKTTKNELCTIITYKMYWSDAQSTKQYTFFFFNKKETKKKCTTNIRSFISLALVYKWVCDAKIIKINENFVYYLM